MFMAWVSIATSLVYIHCPLNCYVNSQSIQSQSKKIFLTMLMYNYYYFFMHVLPRINKSNLI